MNILNGMRYLEVGGHFCYYKPPRVTNECKIQVAFVKSMPNVTLFLANIYELLRFCAILGANLVFVWHFLVTYAFFQANLC